MAHLFKEIPKSSLAFAFETNGSSLVEGIEVGKQVTIGCCETGAGP
jgi:hypothetical protein